MGSQDERVFVDREKELAGFDKLLKPETSQAVMIIEAGKLMGKTWLVGQLSGQCREKRDTFPVVTIDFKDTPERHNVQDTLSLVRLIRDQLEHPQYFDQLNAVINSFTGTQRGAGIITIMLLVERIEQVYDLERLERLAMWLGVVWENLPGNTLFQKAKGLVTHFHSLGDLSVLIEQLEKERPKVDWRQGLESLLGEQKGAQDGDVARGEGIVRDGGGSLPAEGRDLAEAQINEAFLACLQRLMADAKPIVFLFDGCEEAPDEAEKWIRAQLLDRLVKGELHNVVFIFAARKVPYRLDLDVAGVTVKTELDGFDEERVREFFKAHDVQIDPTHIPVLTELSAGNPGMLAQMVDNQRAKRDKEDPFFE